MSFLWTLIAVLFALYLTGNVQAGSLMHDFIASGGAGRVFIALAFAIAGVFIIVLVRMVYVHGLTPRALWNDFKSGKLKF
jgi:hypothetical protein